jgi:cold shock CspA family protein
MLLNTTKNKLEFMKGKIEQWNDDKGFGFIKPDDGSEKVFFHVSCVKTNARRPRFGDIVLFESMRDSQQRPKAKSVVIEGVAKAVGPSAEPKFGRIEPPRKTSLDYILILICISSLAASGLEYFRSGLYEKTLLYVAPAVIAFLFFNRQKKPKEKSFSCFGCKKTADHDSRTIQAWNKGSIKLYCRTCHLEWLKNNPRQAVQGKGSGCLGIFALLIIIPAVCSIMLYRWLV